MVPTLPAPEPLTCCQPLPFCMIMPIRGVLKLQTPSRLDVGSTLGFPPLQAQKSAPQPRIPGNGLPRTQRAQSYSNHLVLLAYKKLSIAYPSNMGLIPLKTPKWGILEKDAPPPKLAARTAACLGQSWVLSTSPPAIRRNRSDETPGKKPNLPRGTWKPPLELVGHMNLIGTKRSIPGSDRLQPPHLRLNAHPSGALAQNREFPESGGPQWLPPVKGNPHKKQKATPGKIEKRLVDLRLVVTIVAAKSFSRVLR